MTAKSGGCLCAAVRFKAAELGSFGVCHCEQCRRWAGSALFGVTVPEAAMQVEGAENIRTYRSSGWASRSFCGQCGAGLWYRFDKGVDGTGDYEVPIGLLDDGSGLALKGEIYADEKPDSWALTGEHERLTRSQTMEKFADLFGGD